MLMIRRNRMGVAALLALVCAFLMLASVVIGKPGKTVVHDGRSPRDTAACDIRQATSKLAKHGRLRHTITLRGRTVIGAHAVVISRNRSVADHVDTVLADGIDGVHARLANHDKTAIFTVKRKLVADAVGNHKRYFWFASSCIGPGDQAPNDGGARQSLKRPKRHH
jgi:hypothetical protein